MEKGKKGVSFKRRLIMEDEEERHRRFVEERNAAQEELFRDLGRHHERFETGMDEEELWSLFDLMKKEARHEKACSLGGDLKEVVEFSLLAFLRHKALESAWKTLEAYLVRFEIPFPSSTSMETPMTLFVTRRSRRSSRHRKGRIS